MNKFYIYAYLRNATSINGKKGEPYYIGKGQGRRMFEKHICSIPPLKENIVILENNLSHDDAIRKEIETIAYYGRLDLGTGILRNLTSGGEGGGYKRIVTEEQRRKSSKSNCGQKRSQQTIENLIKGQSKVKRSGPDNHFYNKSHTDETKKIMSEKKKGKTWEEIYGVEGAAAKRLATSTTMKGKIRGAQDRVKCPHCETVGGKGIMKRWHFDNCKSYDNTQD